MESDIIYAQDLEHLEPIECPQRGGVNYPCAPCQQCPIGEVTMTMGDGYVIENTVNSVLIHLDLPVQDDPLEKAAIKRLKVELSKKVSAIQKGDWEAGELSILLTDEMVENDQLVQDVENFIKQFPKEFRQLMIAAKRVLTNWSENESKQITHEFFRSTQN